MSGDLDVDGNLLSLLEVPALVARIEDHRVSATQRKRTLLPKQPRRFSVSEPKGQGFRLGRQQRKCVVNMEPDTVSRATAIRFRITTTSAMTSTGFSLSPSPVGPAMTPR